MSKSRSHYTGPLSKYYDPQADAFMVELKALLTKYEQRYGRGLFGGLFRRTILERVRKWSAAAPKKQRGMSYKLVAFDVMLCDVFIENPTAITATKLLTAAHGKRQWSCEIENGCKQTWSLVSDSDLGKAFKVLTSGGFKVTWTLPERLPRKDRAKYRPASVSAKSADERARRVLKEIRAVQASAASLSSAPPSQRKARR